MDVTRSVMRLHIAIPALDELDFLPHTLAAIANQKASFPFLVYVCVNQPDDWWNNTEKTEICQNNQKLLKFLNDFKDFSIHVIDKTSKGNGWKNNEHGVGWARKTLFEEIFKTANDEDIIVSLDADTLFSEFYFQSIGENFIQNKIEVLSLPYYHKLTEDESTNRAILRYEIFMRNYFINMHRIDSPYTFTAIGSAIALKVKALRKIRNITPLSSGEDFYLLQKLRKMTPISNSNSEKVYPATRFSTRVPFGTGPAMIKGNSGNWESYPIYHHSLFDKIKETYNIIPELFTEDKNTEFIHFLKEQYKTDDLWSPLRKNFKMLPQFTRAFHEKADGLRILQFLKIKNNELNISDERALLENLAIFYSLYKLPRLASQDTPSNFEGDFSALPVSELNLLRNKLFEIETTLR
ncbi:MAG: glycosyltransferase family 2 protein [Bacteroidetes bacterium]|nr:glycosyltransferase family 2 protein [Bacteroidota bacterium]MCL2301911.1 glycosyltransferase family 2 protein [Lentimicrobiaceae bacterium]